MKVALYYPWIYLKGGIEKVILEIVKRSRHEWTIFTNHFDSENSYEEFKYFNIVVLKQVPVKRDIISVFKSAVIIFNQKIKYLENNDLLFVHSDGVGDFITFKNHKRPIICFCHTPLRIFFDYLYYNNYIRDKGFIFKLILNLFSFPYKLIDKFAWKYYEKVYVNSNEVKRRVIQGGLSNVEKLEVCHPGVDYELIKPTFKYEKYFLVPGRIMWTKNIELAIESFIYFNKLKEEKHKEFKMIIAGSLHSKNKDYFYKLQSLCKGNTDKILFKINIPDNEYSELYDKCYSVIFPSFNEDWGIVPIEAMAYGKPVIVVNSGGPKESVINGKNGFLCEPNKEDIVDKMLKLADNFDLAIKIGKCGRELSKQYDWNNFVKKIDDDIVRIADKFKKY